jgi:hypothetical protein
VWLGLNCDFNIAKVVENPTALGWSECDTVVGWCFGFADKPKMYHDVVSNWANIGKTVLISQPHHFFFGVIPPFCCQNIYYHTPIQVPSL